MSFWINPNGESNNNSNSNELGVVSVNGKEGTHIELNKTDIGLENVLNITQTSQKEFEQYKTETNQRFLATERNISIITEKLETENIIISADEPTEAYEGLIWIKTS